MNQAKRTPTTNTNPRSVLNAISSPPANSRNDISFGTTIAEDEISVAHIPQEDSAPGPSDPSLEDVVSLRINPATRRPADTELANVLESTYESALQIQQLAERLNQNEIELKRKESALQTRVQACEHLAVRQQTEFENRLSQIQQQAANVRCQQLHLMQLQTDIVKSHEATKMAVETLVTESGSDLETVEVLKALKYQLGGRFDYISRRWEHLSELMKNPRVQNAAQQSIDDSVDWTEKLS